jgi:Flp pilus assembly pilin Flp
VEKRAPPVHNCRMKRALRFLQEENGQDLIEYSLLITFVVLGSTAIFLDVNQNATPVWNNAGTQLNAAQAASNSLH